MFQAGAFQDNYQSVAGVARTRGARWYSKLDVEEEKILDEQLETIVENKVQEAVTEAQVLGLRLNRGEFKDGLLREIEKMDEDEAVVMLLMAYDLRGRNVH